MNLTQEPKYGITADCRIFNRASGEIIPDDEPIFIFRARDIHAWKALEHYLGEIRDPEHSEAVKARLGQFKIWHLEHLDRMKEPDTETA